MKKIISLTLALICLISLFSCAKEETGPRSAAGGIKTDEKDLYPAEFLFFQDKEIEFDEFRYYYLNLRDQYLKEDENYFDSQEAEKALKEEALDVLKTAWGARFLAEKHKVKLNSKDKKSVREDIEKTIEFYGGKEEFQKQLEASYMTMDLYHYMMEYSALYLKLFNTLYEDGGDFAWSDEEFYKYYKEHYVAVQQIFIPYKSGESKENYSATLKEANEIYDKAAGGEDFWQLIEKYGKDQNMLSFPDGYYFTKGQAEDVLYEKTLELKEGQISQPTPGETGLYILKRMSLKKLRMDENKKTTLFGYTDTANEFHAGAYDEEFQEKFKEQADKIKIKYSPYWESVSSKSVY